MTPTEGALLEIFSSVLGIAIDISDDLYELGVTSLEVNRVVARMRGHFQLDFDTVAMWEAETLQNLAAAIDAARAEGVPEYRRLV